MASCRKQLIKEFLEVHDILEEQINKKSEVYEKLKIEVLEKTNEISTLTENLQQMIVSINTQKEIIQKLKEETAKYEVHTGELITAMNSRQEERKKLHKKDINHMYVAASALIEVASGKDRRIKELEETLKRKNQEVESLESRSFAAAQIHENNKQIISVLEMKLSNFKEIVHIQNLLKMTNLNMSETPGPKLLEHQMKKPESKEMEQQKSCQGKPIRKIY